MTMLTHKKSSARRYLLPLLLSVATAAFAAPAMADDDDDDRRGKWRNHSGQSDRDDDRRWDRDDRRRYEYNQRERDWQREQARRYEQQRRYDYQRERAYYRHNYQPRPVVVYQRPVVRHGYGYGYGRPPAWSRGRDYRSYGYSNVHYVPYNDYGRYDLYNPGYGQRWVRDDAGNFLLIAAATGIIASILTR